MRKYALFLLVILFIVTNLGWAYLMIDNAITQSYREALFDARKQALDMSLTLLSEEFRGRAKEETAKIISSKLKIDAFEKDGCVVADSLVFHLNDSGKVTRVSLDCYGNN